MRDRRGKGDGDNGGFEQPTGPANPTIAPGKTTRTQSLPPRPVQRTPLATPEERPRTSEHDREVPAREGVATTPSTGEWEADAELGRIRSGVAGSGGRCRDRR